MATRFCGNCGTEVDEDASFCPSCGQPIDARVSDASGEATAAIPPAPAWPASEPEPEPSGAASDAGEVTPAPEGRAADAPPPQHAAPPPPAAAGPPPRQEEPARPGQTQIDVPITWPVTMSGWLIGGGAGLAALGFLTELFALRGAGTAMSVIFLLLMLGLAATVFFSASVPAVPHLRLVTLGVGFAALGVALDRLGFNAAGVGTLLVLVGAGAACAGAVIAELGRDRPMSGPMGGDG